MEGWQHLLSSVQFHEHVLSTLRHWGWGHEGKGGPRPGLLWLKRRFHMCSLNVMGLLGKGLGWTTASS